MDDIIIHSPGLSQSGHACIFAAPWHIQLKDSGDHVTPDQQTPRTRPRFDFTDPKEEWLLPPSLLQQRGAGDDAPPQQHNAGQSELFTAELLRQWPHGALWSNYIWWLIVLQIRCLWAGLSHLHQWKQAHSFISGPREVTSTLSNESCFDS